MSDSKCNVHAHVYRTTREAIEEADSILRYGEYVLRLKGDGSSRAILLRDGSVHYFMSEICFSQWCKSRTYYIGKTLYHSDETLGVGDFG